MSDLVVSSGSGPCRFCDVDRKGETLIEHVREAHPAEYEKLKRPTTATMTCPDWCDSKSGKHESDMVNDATHRCSGCRVCLRPTARAGETTKTARERAGDGLDCDSEHAYACRVWSDHREITLCSFIESAIKLADVQALNSFAVLEWFITPERLRAWIEKERGRG